MPLYNHLPGKQTKSHMCNQLIAACNEMYRNLNKAA